MNILAFDPGTHMGWCQITSSGIESGVQVFEIFRGESTGMRFLRIRAWLERTIRAWAEINNPDGIYIVAFEKPHLRGGASVDLLVGVTTRIQEVCAAISTEKNITIEFTSMHSGTLKLQTTGYGHASKEDMMRIASDLVGRIMDDDNESDAICLAELIRKGYQEGVPITGKSKKKKRAKK